MEKIQLFNIPKRKGWNYKYFEIGFSQFNLKKD
jgi:hypothetical protein